MGGEQAGNGEDDVISFDTTAEDCTVLCSAVQDGTVPDWNEALALAGGGWVLGTAQDGDGSQFSWKSAGRPRAGT